MDMDLGNILIDLYVLITQLIYSRLLVIPIFYP